MKKLFIPLTAGAAALILSSCYTYHPPSPVLLGTKFLPENRTATDRILTEMEVLPLIEAKKIALENNQNYRATFHYVNAARMRYYQSLGAYAPEIRIGTMTGGDSAWAYDEYNPPVNVAGREIGYGVTTTVTASWLLFDGFARYLNTQIQKTELKRQESIQSRVRCMLKRSVAYAYFDFQLADEIERIQNENILFQQKMAALVEPESGKRRPEDELLNYRVYEGLGKNLLLAARNQRAIAGFSLSQLMGYSEGELPVKLKTNPIPDSLNKILYSVDACLEIALENNPDMHIMRELLTIAKYNQLKSWSTFFPTVYADFQYGNSFRTATYRDYMVRSRHYGENSIFYGMHADLLVFNGLARWNRVRETQMLFAAAQFNMAETYLQIVNDIRSAYHTYETAYEQYLIYRGLLLQARKQRDETAGRYEGFQASVSRVDFAQTVYVDIQTRYAVSITEFNKAIAQLEAVMMVDIMDPGPGSAMSM